MANARTITSPAPDEMYQLGGLNRLGDSSRRGEQVDWERKNIIQAEEMNGGSETKAHGHNELIDFASSRSSWIDKRLCAQLVRLIKQAVPSVENRIQKLTTEACLARRRHLAPRNMVSTRSWKPSRQTLVDLATQKLM